MTSRQAPKIRRVVTGHDEAGKPIVWIDSLAPNTKFPDEKMSVTVMWSTDRSPTRIDETLDEGQRPLGTAPPAQGSRFAILEIEPGNEHHRVHRTDTVDYVICLSGEIDMYLNENDVVHLSAGDVLIQRGTDHAWVNRGTEVCRLAVMLLDAEPKREGSVGGENLAR